MTYVTYCCLIRGPAILGLYLEWQPSASEKVLNSKKEGSIVSNMIKFN